MIVDIEQRWKNGQERWVKPPNLFRPDRFRVERINVGDAKEFVVSTHYAGSMPSCRAAYGLIEQPAFGKGLIKGVIVFGVPMQASALARWCGVDHSKGVELSRLVVADSETTGFNAESWFTARAQDLLLKDIPSLEAVLSYSDPEPRFDEHGNETKRGHLGGTYQALNFAHVGRGSPRTLILDRRGKVLSERSVAKFRNGERGRDYALRQIEEASGILFRSSRHESPTAFLAEALASPRLRKVRHPGNIVYVRSLLKGRRGREVAARFPPALPYLTKSQLGLAA